jgi:hypothetical protein
VRRRWRTRIRSVHRGAARMGSKCCEEARAGFVSDIQCLMKTSLNRIFGGIHTSLGCIASALFLYPTISTPCTTPLRIYTKINNNSGRPNVLNDPSASTLNRTLYPSGPSLTKYRLPVPHRESWGVVLEKLPTFVVSCRTMAEFANVLRASKHYDNLEPSLGFEKQ